jgi:hypothetical protein
VHEAGCHVSAKITLAWQRWVAISEIFFIIVPERTLITIRTKPIAEKNIK